MAEPFLEILTRCYRRPRMLAINQAALARQTDPDWQQTLLVDEVGIGMTAANARLADVAPHLVGRYVWALDDDDVCVCDTLVAGLKQICDELRGPELIIVRVDHGPDLGVLPPNELWRERPQGAKIGGSGVIVRRDLWQRCADGWRKPGYMADFSFLTACYDEAAEVVWYDVVAARVQRISHGAPE